MEDCRFYKNPLPTTEDTVIVQIGKANEYCRTVTLLEYNCIEGFVNLSELSKEKRYKKNCVKEGDIVAMAVMRVDAAKKHIDLSKRKVSPELAEELLKQYRYTTNLHRLGKEIHHMYKDQEPSLESVMADTVWKLYDTYEGESEKIYTMVLTNPKLLLGSTFHDTFVTKAVNSINNRISKDNTVKEADVHLLVTEKEGVTLIKTIFTAATKEDTPDYKVTVLVTSPPIYTVRVEGPTPTTVDAVLKRVLDRIKELAAENAVEFDTVGDCKTVKESSTKYTFLSDHELLGKTSTSPATS